MNIFPESRLAVSVEKRSSYAVDKRRPRVAHCLIGSVIFLIQCRLLPVADAGFFNGIRQYDDTARPLNDLTSMPIVAYINH